MARSISSGANTAKNAQYGSEPICVLGIRWGGGVVESKYAERTISFAEGSISSLGSLNEVIQVDSNGTSTSLDVSLLDTDGSLKHIVDTLDIHKNPCVLYQWFDGLAESDSFVLFTGEINSPIVWNETNQTLSFTIVSKIESREVGFSPEEGQFLDVSPSLIGKVWPLAFGEVVHVPAVKSTEKLRGATQTLIGIPDYTLPYKYWHLRERIQILRDGFQYYKTAIYYLLQTLPVLNLDQDAIANILANPNIDDETAINGFFGYISATAQGLEDLYCDCILREDAQRQEFENINIFITEQGKKSDDVEAFSSEEKAGELDADTLNAMQALIPTALTAFQNYLNSSTVLTTAESNSINSIVDGTINTAKKAVQTHIAAGEFVEAVTALVQQYTAILDGAKSISEKTDASLTAIEGQKDVINIDIENAEYAFQHIRTILHKINKLQVNIYKTQREVFKINNVIQQHNSIPKFQVVVTGGERFPQNQDVSISINDMTYRGRFSGKLFTAYAIEPRYSNIPVITSSRLIDSFEIADPTMDLRGHYCLITVPTTPTSPDYDPSNPFGYRIFQVTNQIGTRCTIQLLELNPTVAKNQNPNKLPLIDELPNYLIDKLSTASEHTVEQKKRILENAIPKYDERELNRIKDSLEKLKSIPLEAVDDDTVNTINDTIYKNIREYNNKVKTLKYKTEEIEKAEQKISDEEFGNLLRLQNLKYRLRDQDDEDYEIIQTNRFYYVTGYDVSHIIASAPVLLPAWFQFAAQGQELEQNNTVISLPNGSRIKANLLPDSALWYADVGSTVELVHSLSEKYIVNILPSTISSVYAYRNLNGVRQLVPVPSRYYTKNEADNYGGLTCTSITLKQRLQDYPNEGWDEGIYVSMESSVGPNTVDIIEWIVENYTNYTVDSTTFNSVRSALTNYPSSFALFEKKDALTLIREIAWQARCSVWAVDGVVYIRYLSVNPESVTTITESHILPDSLELQHTTTEDLVTKLTALWRPDYADSEPNQIVLRHNVSKYGLLPAEFDFYIYNIEDLVQKSATFWLIRKANTWKFASFKTPLLKLQLQSFDGVTLDIDPNYFANDPVLGVIQEASYSIQENAIDFLVWLPIRAGEMVPYDFAFPSSIDVDKIYPSVTEISSGYAGGGSSNVPTNVSFTIDPNINLIDQLVLRPKDYGRPFMSDSYDSYPASVIADLQEEDYITLKPEKYSMPEQPRSTERNTKPEYTTPQPVMSVSTNGGPFVARVSSVVDSDSGAYLVKASNNREYAVQQYNGGTDPLAVNQAVTVIRDPLTGQLVINERVQEAGTPISHFKIVSEDDDFLICNPFNAETGVADEETETAIAKPYLLRKSPFDGESFEFTDKTIDYDYDGSEKGLRIAQTNIQVSTPGGDNYTLAVQEAQRIVPVYFVGDVIAAFRLNTGLIQEVNGEETPIFWTDINTGGRVWAHSPMDDPDDTDGS